jgi:hypothetical protein
VTATKVGAAFTGHDFRATRALWQGQGGRRKLKTESRKLKLFLFSAFCFLLLP